MDIRYVVMSLSLAVSLLMLVGKLSAYVITGSAAILADASESSVHLAATSFAAYSLWYSLRPADSGHPYGHGRIAFFSAAQSCIAMTPSPTRIMARYLPT